MARQHRTITRTLAAMEAELDAPEGRFDLGDIGWAVGLSYLDLRLPALGWAERHPRLAAWLQSVSARPSMQATQPR